MLKIKNLVKNNKIAENSFKFMQINKNRSKM